MTINSRIDTQPLEVPVEVPLPLRVSQPGPHTPTHPSKLSFHEELSSVSKVSSSLCPVTFGKMEFAVPLAMSARVRDMYMAVLNVNGSVIHSIERDDVSDRSLGQVNEMLARLNRVTTHIDLDDSTTTSQKEPTSDEAMAEWAEYNSEKFKFLKCLFERIRSKQVHVAIIARAGELLDIVETFLKGIHVAYYRPDTYARSESGTDTSSVEVTLLASGEAGSPAVPKAADLIIALDESFRAEDTQVVKLRNHVMFVGQLAPVVHLLVNKSAEHIEKCFPRTLHPLDRARRIVSCLTQINDEVGHLQNFELSSSAAAEEVAAIVDEGGSELYWESFPKIQPIEHIVSLEISDDLEGSAENETQNISERKIIASSSALKRALVGFDIVYRKNFR